MLIFFDQQNHPFVGVSPRLYSRKIKELDEGLAQFGLKGVGAVKDGIRVDTRGCTSLAALQQYLEAVGAVTVTCEPSDLKVLAEGKMPPEVVGLSRHWPTERFSELLPEELGATMRQTFFDSYTGQEVPDTSDDIGAVELAQIEADLKKAGLELPPETNRLEANLVRDTPLADVSDRYGSDDPTTSFDAIDNYGANL
jgi:hypothetical protein